MESQVKFSFLRFYFHLAFSLYGYSYNILVLKCLTLKIFLTLLFKSSVPWRNIKMEVWLYTVDLVLVKITNSWTCILKSRNVKSRAILSTGTQAHHNAIFDLAWMEEELKLVSVSGDHTAMLWDVSIMPCRQLRQFKGHTRSVKTVAFRPQDKGEISFIECRWEFSCGWFYECIRSLSSFTDWAQ